MRISSITPSRHRSVAGERMPLGSPPSFPPPHSGRSHLNLKVFVYGVTVY